MKKILITFRENAENSGPFQSHKRICECPLQHEYEFIPLYVPIPKKLINPRVMAKFIRKIKEINPDILHIHGLQLEGFCLLLLGKLAKVKKIVCAVHGSSNEAIHFKGYKRWIVNELEKWTLRSADVVYGVSNYVSNWKEIKKYARNYYGSIYNLPDKNNFCKKSQKTNRNKIRNELKIREDSIVITSTGRITEEKGYKTILKMIKTYGANFNNIYFLIVGDGEYLEEMRNQLTSFDNVIFTGYRNDISEILDASDMFISATLHETLGNSIIEAANHGLPVIASNVGGVPEIVLDGITGYLCEIDNIQCFYERINLLYHDKELREKMGANSLKHINCLFNTDKIINSIREMYEFTLNLH